MEKVLEQLNCYSLKADKDESFEGALAKKVILFLNHFPLKRRLVVDLRQKQCVTMTSFQEFLSTQMSKLISNDMILRFSSN